MYFEPSVHESQQSMFNSLQLHISSNKTSISKVCHDITLYTGYSYSAPKHFL